MEFPNPLVCWRRHFHVVFVVLLQKEVKSQEIKMEHCFFHTKTEKRKIHTKSLQGERRMNEIELKLDKLQTRKKEKLHCTKSFYEVLLRSHEASSLSGHLRVLVFGTTGMRIRAPASLAAATYQEHYKTRDGEPHVHPR